ncbi:reducing hydrogenase subunit alpha [Corynebacterium choanae]|uniref:Nickel-dependent hydrogenase n=1 Tax=Corynebacterium choanae TaxID=1862358 RepID=A0A3G6JDZ6_9CORY|nr:reducing hydrogenase subunit alpha [Corynebacterium choanae]AZA14364.1 Nickel-dependent hydrogenase [Corynebacterium choanae]
MAATTLHLDEFVDPHEATVVVTHDEQGMPQVRFDLSVLPRLDHQLVGQPVTAVPDLVKHLCGICPIAHHLAGVQALERLLGYHHLPPTALLVRRLLAAASQCEQLARHVLSHDPALARRLITVGKLVKTAAGCAGHFPDVAIPGGVRNPAEPAACEAALAEVTAVQPLLCQAAAAASSGDTPDPMLRFGASIRLVDNHGHRDPLGEVAAITFPGAPTQHLPAAALADHLQETYPGQPAPRPTVALTGYEPSLYRVGPTAQYPDSPTAQHALFAALEDALATAAAILQHPQLLEGELHAPPSQPPASRGVGVVDGPRGLLLHVYTIAPVDTITEAQQAVLTQCQILTPTAQNEPWLAWMLTTSYQQHTAAKGDSAAHTTNTPNKTNTAAASCTSAASATTASNTATIFEAGIRTADPCLPCTAAPPGAMGVRVTSAPPGKPETP